MARSRFRSPKHILAAVVAVLVLLGGGVAVAGSHTATQSGFRTALVGHHLVAHALHGVATIEPVAQASVAFPVAGTVSSVSVAVGDPVTTGQQLATLDTLSLQVAVLRAQAALNAAQLKLAKALTGQPVTSAGSGAGTGSSSSSSSSSSSAGSGSTASGTGATATGIGGASSSGALVGSSALVDSAATAGAGSIGGVAGTARATGAPAAHPKPTGGGSAGGTDPAITKAEQAVLDAQKQVDADLAVSQKALAAANRACAAVGTPGPTTTTTTPSTAPPTTTAGGDPAAIAACQSALQSVLDGQKTTAADQAALAKASTALDGLLAKQAATPTTPTTPTTAPTRGGSGSGGSKSGSGSGSGASRSTSGSSTGAAKTTTVATPSAADLISYQAAIDAAGANVIVAQQSLAQATIVSPITGTVAAVNLKSGARVAAASATAAIIVVGKGGFEATTSVSVDDLADLRLGQSATVLPDGSATATSGRVVSIGVAADTSGTVATYPVVIGLPGPGDGLRNGATAAVTIMTASASSALAVPTSAINSSGNSPTVMVLTGKTTSTVRVQVGVSGEAWTSITNGLTAGQTVVLADLSAPLPSSATTSSNTPTNANPRFFGGGGGGGGGGFRAPTGGG